jgi:hypothetical protein
VREQRRQWHERCVAALAAAAAHCETEGAVGRGLVYAQRLVESDPLAEHAQRRLMRLHYLRGDRAAAIAAFERFERRLKDELGTRPSAETIELLATIEQGAAALPSRRTTAPASLLRPPRLIGPRRRARGARARVGESACLSARRRGRHRQEPPAAALRGRPAGHRRAPVAPGRRGIAYAVLARLLRAVLAAQPLELGAARTQALALVLPELGVPWRSPARRSACLLQRASTPPWSDAAAHGPAGAARRRPALRRQRQHRVSAGAGAVRELARLQWALPSACRSRTRRRRRCARRSRRPGRVETCSCGRSTWRSSRRWSNRSAWPS